MSDDPVRLVDDVIESTHSVQRTIATLTEEQARGPSLLPGWTRGHVVTHIARNGDALSNLFTWAKTGVETPMYTSREVRSQTIEDQSGRPAAELIADVAASHERFVAAAREMADADWQQVVRWGAADRQGPATLVPWLRRIEVEVHHVDLNLDYTLAHWPEDFVEQMLTETTQDFSSRAAMAAFTLVGNEDQGRWDVAGGGREINGPPPALLGWMLGRSEGIGLYTEGSLPEIGAWR